MSSEGSPGRNTRPRKRKRDLKHVPQPIVTRRKVACETCRSRKIRCSRERPKCSFCTKHENDCTYIETAEDKISLDPATRLIISRLDEILRNVDNSKTNGADTYAPLHRWSTQDSWLEQQTSYGEDETVFRAAKDYLVIPASMASADSVLTWPIFHNAYPPDCLIRHQYHHPQAESYAEAAEHKEQPSIDQHVFDKSCIPTLVDSFLQNVHTKNPVLDVQALVTWGREAARQGINLDARSCILLLACALGSVARSFNDTLRDFKKHSTKSSQAEQRDYRSVSIQKEELAEGERYYHMACQRIGLLKHTVLGSQCHFFAAVYLMYTFRPLEAWTQFYQSSTFFQFYLRSVGGPTSDDPNNHDAERVESLSRQERRIEQTIYWSCFKSEVEMRVEFPLVQSTICSFEYPSLFPTPPTPLSAGTMTTQPEGSSWQQILDTTYGSNIRELRHDSDVFDLPGEVQSLRQHHGALYNEAESWYYYLTEVALRRISNRIVNSFHRVPREAWLQPSRWISLATEFDAQITNWSANLPAAMQTFDASPLNLLRENSQSSSSVLESRRDSVSKELSWCTENRLLEMRSWLYQPFLYCVIHQPISQETGVQPWLSLPEPQCSAFSELISCGIECNLRILHWRALFHRHHGIWFDIRSVLTAVITLCALARSGNVQVPMCLFLSPEDRPERCCGTHQLPCISFDSIFERLQYWEDETPDVKQSRLLVQELVSTVKREMALVKQA